MIALVFPQSSEFGVQSSPRRAHSGFRSSKHRSRAAFTLIELLVVMGIIAILMVLIAPAFTNIKSGTDVTSAAYTIKGVLDTARTYAKANNTYTWVGFYEEDVTATSPTNTAPAYSGVGRLLMAVVFSKDGTKIFEDSDPVAALPPARIGQVGKLVKIENLHLTDLIPPPSPTPNPTPTPGTLDARSYDPFSNSPNDHFNRVSSSSTDTAKFRFSIQNYTFYKTIRFNPGGEANINYQSDTTSSLKKVAEIGLVPTHGNTVPNPTPANVAAIQLGGIGADVIVYRK
jgi:prepilin-type N-terminal cleavage/methylation domain-containing protein